MKRDRRHQNPGRPATIGADARLELRLPAELLERAKKRAERDGVSVSEWIRVLISEALR